MSKVDFKKDSTNQIISKQKNKTRSLINFGKKKRDSSTIPASSISEDIPVFEYQDISSTVTTEADKPEMLSLKGRIVNIETNEGVPDIGIKAADSNGDNSGEGGVFEIFFLASKKKIGEVVTLEIDERDLIIDGKKYVVLYPKDDLKVTIPINSNIDIRRIKICTVSKAKRHRFLMETEGAFSNHEIEEY